MIAISLAVTAELNACRFRLGKLNSAIVAHIFSFVPKNISDILKF